MDNLAYIESLHRAWLKDPSSVDREWDVFFSGNKTEARERDGAEPRPKHADEVYLQSRVDSLLWAYRDVGYIYARLNPLGEYGPQPSYLTHGDKLPYEQLSLEAFGLSEENLDTAFFAGSAMQPSRASLRAIVAAFRETYCGTIGVEFLHIQNKGIRKWLIGRMESTRNKAVLTTEQRRIILEDLLRTEALEHALHTFFMGQKRFSLEGSESIIPALHSLVDSTGRYGVEDLVIGTTHRGRLSILNTILDMSPEEIFSRFEENYQPGQYAGSGDVKYHIGYDTDHLHADGSRVHVSLTANASHLESIDAIVEGKARALQDLKGDTDRKRVLPVLLHGDAAFTGQGVVAETFNLSQLEGYGTGGTIHIVINNQIGFTTPSRSARSGVFATDMAKVLQIPIFHVNGDDPEAIVYVVNLALDFRQTFGRDCVIDVFCYRRHGHNEGDEPSFTHPRMYRLIGRHPGVATLYGQRCAQLGVASREEQLKIVKRHNALLKRALDQERAAPACFIGPGQGGEWNGLKSAYTHEPVQTAVTAETLRRIIERTSTVPEGFNIHPKLARIVERRRVAVEQKDKVDWASAELLAFGSLLLEGVPVRLSGEDSVRGTFAQRHLTWWDTESDTPRQYTPLGHLEEKQAPLAVYDSPLSEFAVLAFEYGYSLVRPHSLVAWEAQFGDFANGAQVIIDNYIVSAETKWQQFSGLVLLLPHGNEGQGPDHASARLERFLQLCADDNLQVCNATTPAQYFHLLRRQVRRGFRKPLVILTPKSLLRHADAVSSLADLSAGTFREVLADTVEPAPVRRVLLCSGKVYYDLLAYRQAQKRTDVALLRVEQLHPFHHQLLAECLGRYDRAREFFWVQEEHRNCGAWRYMLATFDVHFSGIRLHYAGRAESASSGASSHKSYREEQDAIVARAFA